MLLGRPAAAREPAPLEISSPSPDGRRRAAYFPSRPRGIKKARDSAIRQGAPEIAPHALGSISLGIATALSALERLTRRTARCIYLVERSWFHCMRQPNPMHGPWQCEADAQQLLIAPCRV